MKKTILAVLILFAFMLQVSSVYALSASQLRQKWFDAQTARITSDAQYRQAYSSDVANRTPENDQKTVDAGKKLLNAWLDEAEAWLKWKDQEANENLDVSNEIKNNIHNDVSINLAKITGLRNEVNAVKTISEGLMVWGKMVVSYLELLVDVARDSGAMWVSYGNKLLDIAQSYEAQLRLSAQNLSNNSSILAKLDIAKSDLLVARDKVKLAEAAYKQVVIPGAPLVKFAEGNGYLTQAKNNLLDAQLQLVSAFNLITSNTR